MIRLCLGWIEAHPVPVYLGENGTADGVTHGMCADCQRRVNEELDAADAAEQDTPERRLISATVTAHIKSFEERNR